MTNQSKKGDVMALEKLRKSIEQKILDANRVPLREVIFPETSAPMPRCCMDGRGDEPSAEFIPGGGIGLAFDLIASIGHIRGAELDQPQIRQVVGELANISGGIYYHTDEHNFDELKKKLCQHPILAPLHESIEADLNGFLNRGAELDSQTQDVVLEELASNIGCGHAKGVVKHPNNYGINSSTARNVHDAFWRNKWDPNNPASVDLYRHPALPGKHGEKGIVFLWGETAGEIGKGLEPDDQVLVLTPGIEPSTFFLSPPVVDADRRNMIAELLGSGVLGEYIRPNQGAQLQTQMAKRYDQGLAASAALLQVNHLPVFDVVVPKGSKAIVTLRK